MRGAISIFTHSCYRNRCSSAAARGSCRAQGGAMRQTNRSIARAVAVVAAVVVAGNGVARAEVAAKGTFGINVHVSAPFTSGTFDGEITAFDAGPFSSAGRTSIWAPAWAS